MTRNWSNQILNLALKPKQQITKIKKVKTRRETDKKNQSYPYFLMIVLGHDKILIPMGLDVKKIF